MKIPEYLIITGLIIALLTWFLEKLVTGYIECRIKCLEKHLQLLKQDRSYVPKFSQLEKIMMGMDPLAKAICRLALSGLHPKVSRASARHALSGRLFRFAELSSFLLPTRVRREAFEPAYNDMKADYLTARSRFTTRLSRKWLASCFMMHVALMLAQCVWGMCSEKIKFGILKLLPDAVRNFWGG